MRRAFYAPGEDAPYLRELFHQVGLRVEAAGGVDHDDVAAAGDGGLHRVVGDRGRIRAVLGAYEVRPRPLRPDL